MRRLRHSGLIFWQRSEEFNLSAEVVLQPDYVIFAKIRPTLHLDQNEELVPGILYTMRSAKRDIECLARLDPDVAAIHCRKRDTSHHKPVLCPLRVSLIA